MLSSTIMLAAIAALVFVPAPAIGQAPGDPERGTLDGSPLDDLPAHISVLTDFGSRPDWSPDGERLVLIDGAPLGDVIELNVATGETRELTGGFEHMGFARAHYLPTGDLLLCGPSSGPRPSDARPEAGRFTGVMSVLRAPFENAPQPLGMPCWEGMATSDVSLRIAWNRSDIDYTDADLVSRVRYGISEIWTGELRYEGERVLLENVELAIERTAVSPLAPLAVLEVQDFRPGTDELIFTAYAYAGGEVMGVDLSTGQVTNYSQSPVYEEAESVAPNGAWVLVERELDNVLYPGPLDIWLLPLDGSQAWDRLTHFNRYRGGWYASNPAVNPDGTHFAFQLSIDGDVEGEGRGILLFDIAASGRPTAPPSPASMAADGSGCSVGESPSGGAAWLLVAALLGLTLRVRRSTGSAS
jgi:MYXO-CTERM domain-containing protein